MTHRSMVRVSGAPFSSRNAMYRLNSCIGGRVNDHRRRDESCRKQARGDSTYVLVRSLLLLAAHKVAPALPLALIDDAVREVIEHLCRLAHLRPLAREELGDRPERIREAGIADYLRFVERRGERDGSVALG